MAWFIALISFQTNALFVSLLKKMLHRKLKNLFAIILCKVVTIRIEAHPPAFLPK